MKIGIISLGLIGGSLALRLIEQGFDVYAFTTNKNLILKNGKAFTNYEKLKECNIVFICSPLNKILDILKEIQVYITANTIISDVGSVKSFICKEAQQIIRSDCEFIGGHPMAGTEKQGFENAFPSLFENRSWVLMKENKLLESIIQKTNANIVYTCPEKHDQAVAFISHIPLLLSLGLHNLIENIKDPEIKELAQNLASTGYEGMVRLAKGNQTLNQDLLYFNKENINIIFEEFLQETKNKYLSSLGL